MNMHGATRRIKGLYNEPQNTIDIVMIGNSDMYNGVSPMVLWNDLGVTSYHIGNPLETTWVSYYLLRDFYKTQKPKLAIIDMDYIFTDKDSRNDIRKSIDCMKFSLNKLELILSKDVKVPVSTRISYLMPLIRYHSRWNELSDEDFTGVTEKYLAPFKGQEFNKKIKAYKKNSKKTEQDVVDEIPEKCKRNLDKVLKLCKENNTEVIFVYIPTIKSWNQKKSDLISQYAQERNIRYIDYNLNENFNWEKCSRDEGNHLNIYGAEIITKDIESIVKAYNLEDHREDEDYSSWNYNYEIYENLKKN